MLVDGCHIDNCYSRSVARFLLNERNMNPLGENFPITLENARDDAEDKTVGPGGIPSGPDTMSRDHISAALASARTSDECIALAELADRLSSPDLRRASLERAVALDRNNQAALLMLAAESLEENEPASTYALIEEAARLAPLPEVIKPLHAQLAAQVEWDGRLSDYFRAIGRVTAEPPERKLSIVLLTNLFPPQELGGYGRMMWEFAQGLIARGHTVRVLTSDVTQFGKTPTTDEREMEANVFRSLQLLGTWVGGRPEALTDRSEVGRRVRDNASRLRTAVAKLKPDLILVGNLDFFGTAILRTGLDHNVPVLHALANAAPGYRVSEQPTEPHYWVAPCSDWNGDVFRQEGFTPNRIETLYPGARIDRFFRLFLPDTRRLRICYASLVLPYKGVDTLVAALVRLHAAGVDFSAEIAGDTPDQVFFQQQQEIIRAHGMESKVRFTGFLDRNDLAALFGRSNVLVFPSRFQEPFGISQVEALAAGLVVVSSGTGGAKEIIRNETDGLLFTAGDETDLTDKLTMLANDPELMARLQRQGQARAAAFSVENSVLKIEALADELQAVVAAEMEPAEPV